MRPAAIVTLLCGIAIMPASASELDAKFLIEREGKVIGYHSVDVTETSDGAMVETSIEMKVNFGPLPVFRYEHRALEEWRGAELVALSSRTNQDGEKMRVEAIRNGEILEIDGSGYRGPAPAGAVPSSYWRKTLVDADALINTQTGEVIDVTVEALGRTPGPHDAVAEQYRVTGTVALNIWYDGPRWVGSNFIVDGEELTYVLVEDERQYSWLEKFAD